VDEFDDVIVGGGSAGIVLATRLTEDPSRRVLLIEAGPDHGGIAEPDRLRDQMRFSGTLTAWGTDATFAPGLTLNYPQGRTMGGGSAVNGAFAVRGLPDDAARWAAAGGADWAWPHLLRAFRRLEADRDLGAEEHHGADGPVPIVRWRRDELLPVQQAFLAAVVEHGIPWIDDLNAPDASGIGLMPMNRQGGVRMSTALTYLPLARDRANLVLRPGTEVARLVLDGQRAVGVELRDGAGASGPQQVRAGRVVLSAGALQSPTLLLRSGIGPAEHLADVGVDCVVDLPGVGEHLVDHQGVGVFLVPRDELPPPDDRVCQLGARFTSSTPSGRDDMWLSLWSAWELEGFPDLHQAMGVPAISTIAVGVHDPLSRGTVRLRTADPAERPVVDFRMLTEPADLARLVEGLRLALELAASGPMSGPFRGTGLLDPETATDQAALEAYIRGTVGGWYHAAGTCRMGADPDGGDVVDGRLRVHGVDGLHVVDASVMPTIPRAPTNLSSIALAERAAELLRA
jgi:choline dehydrogenase